MPDAGLRDLHGADRRIAWGTATTVAAVDTIVSGLNSVEAVYATLQDDPVDGCMGVSAVPGTGGTFSLKTWGNTGGTDPTPAAASTFSKKVMWIAVGS